jgi:hypothetical protein
MSREVYLKEVYLMEYILWLYQLYDLPVSGVASTL